MRFRGNINIEFINIRLPSGAKDWTIIGLVLLACNSFTQTKFLLMFLKEFYKLNQQTQPQYYEKILIIIPCRERKSINWSKTQLSLFFLISL